MVVKILSASLFGLDVNKVEVEVDVSYGMPSFNIVGLPDTAVKESKDRVCTAIKNASFDFPYQKITVNLAPADMKKEGPSFDLPIALGILAASEQIDKNYFENTLILGELSLDGTVKSIKGILSISDFCQKANIKNLILPYANAKEGSVVKNVNIYPVNSLLEVVNFLNKEIEIKPFEIDLINEFQNEQIYSLDFTDIKGQLHAKRALEIAAAGRHNVILIGPPGSGKTMLAQRFPSILPNLTLEESIEITKIYSVSGLIPDKKGLIVHRPFRHPHHTTSDIGLIGGGKYPKPGEVSLSHLGVLFLDEFSEFKRSVLEVMRQPLEDGEVTISRASSTITYPSKFILISAMNPCPCGFLNDPKKECKCSYLEIKNYKKRISGPLLDRIDIHVEVPSLKYQELITEQKEKSSDEIKQNVNIAIEKQKIRFKNLKSIYGNSMMEMSHIKKFCKINENCQEILRKVIEELGISARAYYKIIKISRTIADLDNSDDILENHLIEAIQYRTLDRKMN